MLTDEWKGMRIYRSDDLKTWKQGLILADAGKRRDDTPSGAHGDVAVFDDKAYVFYFTHPGRKNQLDHPNDPETNILPFKYRRSSIHVAPLIFKDGTLTAPHDQEFDFFLPNGE